MKKVLMYGHASSQNHGCEAIIRTISGIIDKKYPETHYTVSSFRPDHDRFYIGEQDGKYEFIYSDVMSIRDYGTLRKYFIGAFGKLFHRIPMFSLLYKDTVCAAKEADVIISVGGDSYSYGQSVGITTVDNYLRKLCPRSVLWGCSINPELLEGDGNKYKLEGLKHFSLITARESITYEALKSHGLNNVKLYPDPAFTLPATEPEEPMFDNGCDTVGINISPLICGYESNEGIAMRSYAALIRHILETTDWNIALVSHVIKKTTDDSEAAMEIMKQFPNEERIRLFDRGDATQIKGCISKCRFFVAARTHASIAAYSNCIPTLVVGYSVKAKGIAKDLFGSWEDYVLPVESLSDESSLYETFEKLVKNEDAVRARLVSVMPDYIRRAEEAGDEIVRLLEECSD